jgi:hypothetical protein
VIHRAEDEKNWELESFTHNADDPKISYSKQDTIDIILTATKMNH